MRKPAQIRPLGCLTVTRIVTERLPITSSTTDGTLSVGQMIDEHLNASAQRGESIQTVRLEFEPEQWEEIATTVYCGFVDA
jgi:hypothetical protein